MKFAAKIRPWFRELDGWWYVTRRINGRRVQQKLVQGRDNEEAAYREFHELMAASGAVQAAPDISFNELAYLFLAWSKQHQDENTFRWYGRFLTDFDGQYHGPVLNLRKGEVETWLDQHPAWGQSTRRQAITCIKRLINWGYEQGHLPKIPEGLRSLKRPPMKRRRKVLSDDEHRNLMKNTDGPFRQFLFALRETGARPGEVRTVTAEMVNLKLGVWLLDEHKTAEKTDKPRVIYLTPTMHRLTARLVAKYPTGPLFRNGQSRPWTSNAIRCRFRRLREKLGLEAGTVAYAYRHTFATDGLQRGVPIAELAELLGHTSTRMLCEHYGHLDQRIDHMRTAAQKAARST